MVRRNYLTEDSSPLASAQAPERSTEEIRQNIAATRESITETVDQLSDRFQRTFDWRTYVANYPLVALGVAAGLGFLVVGLFKPRPSPKQRITDAIADTVEDVADRFRHQLDDTGLRGSSGLGRAVKAAATGAIVKAATDYLHNRLAERDWDEDHPDNSAHSVASDDRYSNLKSSIKHP